MLTKIKNLFSKDGNTKPELNSPETKSTEEVISEDKPAENVSASDANNSASDVQNEIALSQEETPEKNVNTEEIKEEVIRVLKTCYDPEIPVDVWELGLIYDILVATNGDVMIVMTLTSPSCPVAGILPNEIEQRVREHPKVSDCKVQLTFDPPWNQNMMSEVAKLELGFL